MISQVLRGSHKAGRIDHIRVGDQVGADLNRVEHLSKANQLKHCIIITQLYHYWFINRLIKVFPLVNVELDPGDALFFHSNVLHRSEQNHSDRRRWAFLMAYNAKANDPVKKHHHPQYTPLKKVRLRGWGIQQLEGWGEREEGLVLVFTVKVLLRPEGNVITKI